MKRRNLSVGRRLAILMMQQLAGKNEAQITMKISFFGTVSVDGSEILHQLIDSLSHGFTGLCTSQVVVWDF